MTLLFILLFHCVRAKVDWLYCDVSSTKVEVSPRGERYVTLFRNTDFESKREPENYCLYGPTDTPGHEMCRRCSLDLLKHKDGFRRSFIMYLFIFAGCGFCLLYMTDN